MRWLIEHQAFGVYVGVERSLRTGKLTPTYRRDSGLPARTFLSVFAAKAEVEAIAKDAEPFRIIPLY